MIQHEINNVIIVRLLQQAESVLMPAHQDHLR